MEAVVVLVLLLRLQLLPLHAPTAESPSHCRVAYFTGALSLEPIITAAILLEPVSEVLLDARALGRQLGRVRLLRGAQGDARRQAAPACNWRGS